MKKSLPAFTSPPELRSRNMRAIRSTGNATTERKLISVLMRGRLRGWRIRPKEIHGVPDFVFLRGHLAVFVDGCFFHGHPSCGHVPKTNAAYWRAKILRNRRRDASVSRKLRSLGFSVIRIWECQLKRRPTWCLNRIVRALEGESVR